MVEILDRVKNIESKLDYLPRQNPAGVLESESPTPRRSSSFTEPSNFESDSSTIYQVSSSRSRETLTPNAAYHHSTASHKVLQWPAVQQFLQQTVPSNLGDTKSTDSGLIFIVKIQGTRGPLSLDVDLQEKPFVGMQSLASRVSGGSRITFPGLARDTMHQLATTYFDTFNFMYPFMDRQTFLSETLAKVTSEGFDGDMESVIALLVFALGDVALEGIQGSPVNIYNGRPSGVRGGTGPSKPPGLSFFNEAMKRIGCVLTECSLENVQMFSLTA